MSPVGSYYYRSSTGAGRQFTRGFAHGFFDNVLGMSPGTANLFAGIISHTLLASGLYIGLSSFTMPASYSGPDYTIGENQNGDIVNYANNVGDISPGGNSTNNILANGGKHTFLKEGAIASDIAFKNNPPMGKILGALQIRHSASLINYHGTLVDSSSFSLAFGKAGYSGIKGLSILGTPWTGTCHQSTFNTLMLGGVSSSEAFTSTILNVGWSFMASTALYGVNGVFGMSAIANTQTRR